MDVLTHPIVIRVATGIGFIGLLDGWSYLIGNSSSFQHLIFA
jgi:hypothetical protein